MNGPNKLPANPGNEGSDAQADRPAAGVIVVDKPIGPTSMRVVSIIRKACNIRKVGHAGTLDPMASGVLVIAIGMATKSLDRFMHTTKRYRTTINLSAVSKTDDLESEPVPVHVPVHPTRERIDEALRNFTGRIEQIPPAHSAVNVGGFRAYELARQGINVPLASRTVHIHDIHVVKYDWPTLEIEVVSSKGMYVRSLARDIGRALGTGGYCAALRRTAVGPFDESMAIKLDDIWAPMKPEYIIPLEKALAMVEQSQSNQREEK